MHFQGVEVIDVLTLTVPADGIESIGIGAHSDDEAENAENGSQVQAPDPQRTAFSNQMKQLWNALSEQLKSSVTSLGLCDLETDIFIDLFNQAPNPPKNFQVNLKSCCVVPPILKDFAKENNVQLQTHADSPSILSSEFESQITSDFRAPQWIVRYQLFIKARGVLRDKRYLIHRQ